MKNKLKQFYETLNEDILFEELSHTAICIIELSDAYKSYLKSIAMKTYAESLFGVVDACDKLNVSIKDLKRARLISNLKYIGNVLLCGFMAILFVMLAWWHILKNDQIQDEEPMTLDGVIEDINTSMFKEGDTLYYGENGTMVLAKYAIGTTNYIGVVRQSLRDNTRTVSVLVYNKSGCDIIKGSVVYPVGSHDGLTTVKLLHADNQIIDSTDFKWGITKQAIPNNSKGWVLINEK